MPRRPASVLPTLLPATWCSPSSAITRPTLSCGMLGDRKSHTWMHCPDKPQQRAMLGAQPCRNGAGVPAHLSLLRRERGG